MSTLEALPAWSDDDRTASTPPKNAEPARLNLSALAPEGHAATSVPLRNAAAYEGALARIFSELFQPADLGPTPGSTARPRHTPGRDIEDHPEAVYLLAASLLAARRMARAAYWLRRLDSISADLADQQQWQGRSAFLWTLYAEQTGDIPTVLEQSATAARLIASDGGDESDLFPAGPRRGLLRTVDKVATDQLPLLAARAHIALGELHEAQRILIDRYGGEGELESRQPAMMAMLACRHGRLSDAVRLANAALHEAQRRDSVTELVDVEARLVLAEVLFERNELDAAREQLHAALELCCVTGATSWMWSVELDLARLSIAQQRPNEAGQRLHHLRRIKEAGFLSQSLEQKLNQVEIDCRLQLGDLDGALLITRSSSPRDISNVTLARVDLRCGRPDQALSRLHTEKMPYPAAQLRQQILVACAEHQLGRPRATDIIRRAVEAAQPEGYLRPFLEETIQILPLLQASSGSTHDPYGSRLLREAVRLVPAVSSKPAPCMLEPLTEREREVLQYLPSHLSVRQIAVHMCLSPNTVKTHVRAIYRKSGAVSRDDAVTIARGHGLL
jgi:DNA-binding CsgD family transcriptional regulator